MFNLGFLGSIKAPHWDLVPARQKKHGYTTRDVVIEMETWPMRPLIQNMIPRAQQRDSHISIQLKENFGLL